MATWPLLRFFLVTLALAAVFTPATRAQTPKSGESLTVDDVVKLSQAGISEDVIITRIRKNGKAFDLSPDEIVELKKTGISNSIINFLLDPSQPYTPAPVLPPPSAAPNRSDGSPAPPPPAPSPPAKHYPADANASKVPFEPGLYRFPVPGEAPVKLDIKILLGTNEGAGLGKVLMKKGKIIAYLVGPASKTRIKEPAPVFYLRLPDGKAIEDIILIAFDRKADRREIEMGPPGPKQELKAEAMRQFESLEVGQALFKLTAAQLAKGEYFFFQLGSAEPPKGSYGKGFDFGIDEPHK